MHIETKALWLPKRGNTPEEYEDAFWLGPAKSATGALRCAVADGATEASFSRQWARALTKAYGHGTLAADTFAEDVTRLRASWQRALAARTQKTQMAWYAEQKAEFGAFAALVGLELHPDQARQDQTPDHAGDGAPTAAVPEPTEAEATGVEPTHGGEPEAGTRGPMAADDAGAGGAMATGVSTAQPATEPATEPANGPAAEGASTAQAQETDGETDRAPRAQSAPADEAAPEPWWEAVAIGDSNLFQLRHGTVHTSFPLVRSDQFSGGPFLIGTNNDDDDESLAWRLQRVRGDLRSGDTFYMMSDALACWFLKCCEAGEQPWQVLDEVLGQDDADERFTALVAELRDQRLLQNDDVTLVRVAVDRVAIPAETATGPYWIEADETTPF